MGTGSALIGRVSQSSSRAADRLPGAERIAPPEDEGWAAIPGLLGV